LSAVSVKRGILNGYGIGYLCFQKLIDAAYYYGAACSAYRYAGRTCNFCISGYNIASGANPHICTENSCDTNDNNIFRPMDAHIHAGVYNENYFNDSADGEIDVFTKHC
jgi:hypothetical protein